MSYPISTEKPRTQTPHALTVNIDWRQYGADGLSDPYALDLAVAVNLQQGVVYPLDKVRSVYIDNSFSDIIVSVQFRDTNYVITCAARESIWLPVVTNLLDALIIGQNFAPGEAPLTTVIFSNLDRPPFSNTERNVTFPRHAATNPSGTSAGTRDLVEFFRAPALGDLIAPLTYPLFSDFALIQIGGTPYPVGYSLYITNLRLDALKSNDSPANEVSISTADLIYGDTGELITTSPIRMGVESTLVGVTNITVPDNPIYDLQGTQIRLNASRTIYLRLRNNRPVSSAIPPFHAQLQVIGQIVYSVHFDNANPDTVVPPFLPVNLSFVDARLSNAVLDVYSFLGVNLGTTSFERVTLLCVTIDVSANSGPLAVSVNGQDAVLIAQTDLLAGVRHQKLSVYACPTTDAAIVADILVGCPGISNFCTIALFRMTGTRGSFAPFQSRSAAGGPGVGGSILTAVDIPANGGAIAFAVADGLVGVTATWTGILETFNLNPATDEFTGGFVVTPFPIVQPIQTFWTGAHNNTAQLAVSFAPRT